MCSDVEQDNVEQPNIDNQVASLSPIEDNLASIDEEHLLAAQPAKRSCLQDMILTNGLKA